MQAAVPARAPFGVTLPRGVLVAGALALACLLGAALAANVSLGLAVLAGLIYLPLPFVNLPLAIALWLPLAFVSRLEFVSVAPNLALLLLIVAWLGTLLGRGATPLALLRENGRVLALLAAFAVWLTLSAAWASDPELLLETGLDWVAAGLIFALVVGTVARPEHAYLLAGAFVAGAVTSVLVGLVDPPVTGLTALDKSQISAEDAARLGGGSGDPNYLAAALVPALVLLPGLARDRRPLWNLVLMGAGSALAIGLAASGSRGGLIAAGVAILGSLLFLRSKRPYVVATLVLLAGVSAAWFSVNPDALERVTTFDEGGNSRTELWQVAVKMTEDHPVVGVGLENFVAEAGRYVRQPGQLKFVDLIAERPSVAHNLYLQLLAETGAVGLGLYLALLASCLASAWKAGRLAELNGDSRLAALAQAILVAILASGTASIFISNATDRRSWVLFALGPAVLVVARRAGASRAEPRVA